MTSYDELDEVKEGRPPSENSESVGDVLHHYWRLLRQYYWVLGLATMICIGAAYAWSQQQTEMYTASSEIIFHKKQGSVMGRGMEQVEMMDPGGRWEFEQFWNTQKQVFTSRWFAERVVKRIGLLEHPDFVPTEDKKGNELSREQRLDKAIDRVLGSMAVDLHRESRVGIVSVKLPNPELTAEIANATAEAYVEYTKEFQSGGLKEITNWFDSYVEGKKTELEEAQSELQKFKRKNNILSLSYEDRRNLTASNIETVNSELMNVETKLSSERTLLEQIKELQQAGRLGAVGRLAESESLSEALRRQNELEEDLADLKTRYKEKHPEVQALTSKLETVNENVEQEVEQIRESVENRVDMLEQQKREFQTRLDNLKSEVFDLNELGVDFNQLQNRKENLEELYNTVLKRSSELNMSSMYQPQDIQVLEHASVPKSPVEPNVPMNLALGALLGMIFGAMGIFVADAMDTTVKRKEDITQHTNKPILAMLPKMDQGLLGNILQSPGESSADTITHTAPKSSFAEGIKTLRTNLTFMAPDEPPELILVTSPGPKQGKTLTTVNTGIAMAQSEQETLIIDTDIRRPRVHKTFGLDNTFGLTSFIKNDHDFDAVVRETLVDNLSVVLSGQIPPNPSELLHSDRFDEFVETARERYDRVLFDSPPLAAVSDALILSHSVDGVLLMVQFGKTRREALTRSLEQLREIGAPLLGCILNEVPSSGSYGYEYYRYSYYGSDEDEQTGDVSKLAS